jgi:hypothetical protein
LKLRFESALSSAAIGIIRSYFLNVGTPFIPTEALKSRLKQTRQAYPQSEQVEKRLY